MRFSMIVGSGAVLAGTVTAQESASKYFDFTTGITFSSITHANGVSYRVALPVNSPTSDAIVQIVSPTKFAWCGLAWGGHMTNNPLSVAWPTGETEGQKAIVSSRMAFGYYQVPLAYEGATYTLLPSGVTTNATHWQITARCQGCTRWSSADGDFNLENEDNAVVAYACSSVPPDDPKNNETTFYIHDEFGIWSHDLTIAKNESFGQWVGGNGSLMTRKQWTA